MVAEWSRAPANSFREEGDVGSSPSPAKITFSDEIFLNNSRVGIPTTDFCSFSATRNELGMMSSTQNS